MKLKPTIKGLSQSQIEEPRHRKHKDNKLPPDGYRPMFSPIRFLVRETPSKNNINKVVKQYVEISVKRFEDDDDIVNEPYIWLQMYQESEFYTGYLKGKTVYLPLAMLYDLIENLHNIDEECEKRGIE